ncbi:MULTISPECIES: endonuclease domain-containing protein [Sphingomonas]|uniref:DUF559 domain-containing protein n=1 Tax=Sphingomonas molluscorum TaxID=418184 RepID=A0ABU8Q4F9_9SPHN
MVGTIPPRNGEGDQPQAGGGGAPRTLRPEVAQARSLRRQMTLPEVLLWQQLRGSQLGVRFRRQHPVGPYIVDFFCASASLAVEVDGTAHDYGDRPARDAERDRFLSDNGIDVLRLCASDVLRDIGSVLAAIAARVARPLHQPAAGPPPRAGEEQEFL